MTISVIYRPEMDALSSYTRYKAIAVCNSCGYQEEAHKVGLSYNWNDFDIEIGATIDSGVDYSISTCQKCGHSARRERLGLARLKHRDKVHICLTQDEDSFISRCGSLSGSVSLGKVIEVEEFTSDLEACKGCAVNEGILYKEKPWFNEEDQNLGACK